MIENLKHLDLNKYQWLWWKNKELVAWYQIERLIETKKDWKDAIVEYKFIEKEKEDQVRINPEYDKKYEKIYLVSGFIMIIKLGHYNENKEIILGLLRYQPTFKKAFFDHIFN